MHQFLDYEPMIKNSLRNGMPIIGIETSSIFSSLDYPKNIQTALSIKKHSESIGVMPAFLALIEGRIKVGLTPNELEKIANQKNIINASNLTYNILKKYTGTFDLTATLLVSKLIGIKIISTDVIKYSSLDVEILKSHNILIVSSGLLDINYLSTYELIKNNFIPLIGYDTNQLHLLFDRSKEIYLDSVIIDETEASEYLNIQNGITDFASTILINPINIVYKTYNLHLDTLFDKINSNKNNETALISKIHEYTKNDSVNTHIQSMVQNARLASFISSNYFKIKS